MSAGSVKKKRIGSSRRVRNQNMTPEADEFHQLSNTTVVQHCIPEENTEPLNVSANPDYLQFETQNAPPTKSRRKLGSSRRNVLQHVKNWAAKSYPNPKDVEEKNLGYETPKSTLQLSLAMQPHRKEEYSKEVEQQLSATCNSPLYSAITPDYIQVQNSVRTNCQKADLESLNPKREHLLADQDENYVDYEVIPNSCKLLPVTLEEIDRSHILVSEKVDEKSHLVGILDLTSLSVLSRPTVHEQEFSTIPEITTDNSSPRKNTELEYNVEQEKLSTPNEKLPKDEEQNRHSSFQDKNAQRSEDAVNTVHEHRAKAKEIHANTHSSDSVANDTTAKYEITFGNVMDQPEVNDTYQSDLILKSAVESATKQEDSNPREQSLHPTKVSSSASLEHSNDDHDTCDTKNVQISATKGVDTVPGKVYKTNCPVEEDLSSIERAAYLEKEVHFETEESESSMQSEIQACFDSHTLQTDSNFTPAGNRRELESSSRNKGRQHAEAFVAETSHGPTGAAVEDAMDNESLETKSLAIDTYVWGKSTERVAEQAIVSSKKEGVPTSEGHSDIFNLSVIKGSYHFGEAVHMFDKQEMTQMNEIYQIDLSSVKDCESSLQTLLSESNAPLGPQTSHVGRQEQTQKGINLYKDVVNTRGSEIAQVVGAVKRTSQEKICQESEHGSVMPITHGSSLYSAIMPGYSSEAQNPTTTADSADLKCSISKMKNLQKDHNERDTEVSEMERLNKSDTFENQGVRGDHQSKDAINNVNEKEVKPRHEINRFSQSMACDTIANFEIISVNLLKQSEVSDTYQYKPLVEGADDVTKADALYPDDSNDMAEEENHFKALDDANEEDYVYDGNILQIRSIEREDTAQGQECEGQVEDNIKSLQSEEQACLDVQPKRKETRFNFMGHKKKLGSSRRNKEGKRPKDFAAELYHSYEEEIVENTGFDEPLEAKIHFLATETNVQEESMETTRGQVDTFTTAQTAVSDQDEGNVHGGTLVGISKHSASSLHSSPEEIVNEEPEEVVEPTQMLEMHQTDFLCNKENDPSVPTLQSESNAPLNRRPQESFMRIEEQNHTGLNPIKNRRKLGSSRRNKGCLHIKEAVTEPEEEFMENSSGDEALETTKMFLAAKTGRKNDSSPKWGKLKVAKHTNIDVKLTQETRENRAILNDDKNTGQILHEGTILFQNVMDNSKTVRTDVNSCTGIDDKEINTMEKNTIKAPENLSPVTGYDRVKIDFIQSSEDDPDIEGIAYHDRNVTARSNTLDPLEHEDANQVQTTEALSDGNNSPGEVNNVQQRNGAIETVRDVAIKGHSTESWRSMEVSRQVEEICQIPTERDREVIKASQEITHTELLFSLVHNSKDTSGQCNLEEDFRAEPAVDVHEKSEISTTGREGDNQTRIQVNAPFRNAEKLQEKSKQKRRKMGSTRRSLLNRKPEKGVSNKGEMKESESNMQADTKDAEQMVVVQDLPLTVIAEVSENEHVKPSLNPPCEGQQEANEGSIVHNKEQRPQRSTSVLQRSAVLFVPFDHVADITDSERSVDVDRSGLHEFTGTEMLGGRKCSFMNPVQSSNTQDVVTSTAITGGSASSLSETAQSTQNDEECLQIINSLQGQAFTSAEPPVVVEVTQSEIGKSDIRGGAHEDAQARTQELNSTSEGVLSKNAEMENASPNLKSANRRRKMGSTRRNLTSPSKGEYLHQKQDGDNKATDVTKNVADVQFESDSEQREEKAFETVKRRPTAHDAMSRAASGGRSRKLGSHRRLRGRGRDARGIIDGHSIETTEEESLDLDKISEVDGSDKKSPLNMSTYLKPVCEKTPVRVIPVQHPSAEMCQSQESKNTFTLGKQNSNTLSQQNVVDCKKKGGATGSNSYNVMIIGDSSVGKTSFMKRAQSGTFRLDLPNSVGLDFCMWTMVTDGEPVMLQLWDTAGQERYHSITRQMFHRAQAFLLMYDITSSQSFSAVSYWANCIQEGAAENVTILLLGNKCDHAERRIKPQEGQKLATEYDFIFMECSAATGENVIDSLETVARMLSQTTETREEITAIHKEPQQKKSTICC